MAHEQSNTILVVCPLGIEAKAARKALNDIRLHVQIRVVVSGPGVDAVKRAVCKHASNTLAVILFGVAGGLVELAELAPAISEVVASDGKRYNASSRGVTIAGVDAPILTPTAKAELHEQTGAMLVDTESHAFAAACEERGLRWRVIRGISDPFDQTLPEPVVGWIKPDGRTDAGRVLIDLVSKPGLIRAMIRLASQTSAGLRAARRRLIDTVQELTQSESPESETPELFCGEAVEGGVVIFGGTFDPPHVGHVRCAAAARDELETQHPGCGHLLLVFVPAARSPHKQSGPVASDADRVAMLELAIGDVPRAKVWDEELTRVQVDQPSYSADTIQRVRQIVGQKKVFLLIGSDQAVAFHRWRLYDKILENAELAVQLREPFDSSELFMSMMRELGVWSDHQLSMWENAIVKTPIVTAVATDIRTMLDQDDTKALGEIVDERVLGYIRDRGLYRSIC